MPDRIPAIVEDCPEWRLPTPLCLTLQGASKAGQQTGFMIKEWKLGLDAGIERRSASNTICISHSHVDHSWNFPLCTCSRWKIPKGCEKLGGCPVYTPTSAVPLVDKLQETCIDLASGKLTSLGTDVRQIQRYVPFGVEPGQTIDLPGLPAVMEVLPAYHPADSVGFGFATVRNKLKEEYRGLKGPEIGKLRKSGVVITEPETTHQFVFYGDTSIRALNDHEEWTKYPVVIIESTHYPFMKITPEESARRGHIHWQDLFFQIKKNPEIFFVVIHSSTAVTDAELLEFESMIREVHRITNFRLWTVTPRPEPEDLTEIEGTLKEKEGKFVREDDRESLSGVDDSVPVEVMVRTEEVQKK